MRNESKAGLLLQFRGISGIQLDQGRRTGLDYRDNPWQGGSTSLSGDID
jgi:hypothetical protein